MQDDDSASGGNGAGKTRGRKPKNVSQEERTRRNLENQRAFRQRKEEYIKSIELENEALKAQLAGQAPAAMDPRIAALENRILALETENTLLRECGVSVDLKASFGPQAVNICSSCASEKMKTLVVCGKLQRTQEELKQLKSECDQLRTAGILFGNSSSQMPASSSNTAIPQFQYFPQLPTHSESPSNSRSAPSIQTSQTPQFLSPAEPAPVHNDWWEQVAATLATNYNTPSPQQQQDFFYLSSTDLYGPPETTRIRRALKCIPSLHQSPLVDTLIASFEAVCGCRDRHEIQRLHLKTTALKGQLFDQCTLLDRQKAIEEWTVHVTRNWDHIKHKYSCFEHILRDPIIRVRPLPEQGLMLREQFLSIPGLRGCVGYVDDFLTLFYNPHVKGTGEHILLKMLALGQKMEILLHGNLEDKIKFSLMVEMGRESGKARMDELLADVAANASKSTNR